MIYVRINALAIRSQFTAYQKEIIQARHLLRADFQNTSDEATLAKYLQSTATDTLEIKLDNSMVTTTLPTDI